MVWDSICYSEFGKMELVRICLGIGCGRVEGQGRLSMNFGFYSGEINEQMDFFY